MVVPNMVADEKYAFLLHFEQITIDVLLHVSLQN